MFFMKKITLIALLFALTWQASSQTLENSLQKRNELKLDVAFLLGSTLKVEYEYWLTDWSSVGASALYGFGSNGIEIDGDFSIRFQMLGTYRLYFGKEPTRGFFLEGNLGIVHGKESIFSWNPVGDFTAFGVGIALGWKWYIPRSGIVLDIFGGAGRLFGDNGPGAYPRAGVAVGKRF